MISNIGKDSIISYLNTCKTNIVTTMVKSSLNFSPHPLIVANFVLCICVDV